jgi:hypothetical protein
VYQSACEERRELAVDVESDTGMRMGTGTKLSELSERQLFTLRRRLASGVHDPALTLRGALITTCGVARARTVAAGRASCTAPTRT